MSIDINGLKAGDRVKVVLEGEITEVIGDRFYLGADGRTNRFFASSPGGHVKSIELLEPALPTAFGSVISAIIKSDFSPRRLSRRGNNWYGDGGFAYPVSDLSDIKVLFDAGKAL